MNEFTASNQRGSSNIGLAQTLPKKLSQVEGQIEFIKQDLSYLQDRISCLTGKLSSILRPECEKAENVGTPQESLIPLGEVLRGFSDSIKYNASNIENLINRLEL